MHDEPAFVALGFKSNRRGGWWFREPSNRYTIQIVPSGGKERRGWCLGIARPSDIKWGKKAYPSPEAAAFQAFRVVDDIAQADRLAEVMRAGQEERMQAIVERIKKVKEAKSERQRNP